MIERGCARDGLAEKMNAMSLYLLTHGSICLQSHTTRHGRQASSAMKGRESNSGWAVQLVDCMMPMTAAVEACSG
jgi:hypothetical protein